MHLFEKWNVREEERSTTFWFTPPITTIVVNESGRRQEPGTQCGSLTWVAGAHPLGPSSNVSQAHSLGAGSEGEEPGLELRCDMTSKWPQVASLAESECPLCRAGLRQLAALSARLQKDEFY